MRGITENCLQMIHVYVFLAAPLGVSICFRRAQTSISAELASGKISTTWVHYRIWQSGRSITLLVRKIVVGYVLNLAYGHPCAVHLNQRFLCAAFTAAITINDRCLEGHALQARHKQRDVSRGRDEIPIVMSGVVPLTDLVSLAACHLRQFIKAAHSAFLPRFHVCSRI